MALSPFRAASPPGPPRGALVQEGGDTLLEVGAVVARPDEVVTRVLGEEPVDHPPDRLLADAQREGRGGGDGLGQLPHPALQGVEGDDLVDEAPPLRLPAVDVPPREDHLLGPRGPDERDEAGVVLHGEAVPEADDGHAEPGVLGGDPEVAGQRDGEPSPHGVALDGRHRGLPDGVQPPDDLVDPLLVLDAGFGIPPKRGKLGDVGPRDEGPVPAPRHDQDLDPVVPVDLLAHLDQARVHLPGHGVPLLGAVDREVPDPVEDLEEHGGGRLHHGADGVSSSGSRAGGVPSPAGARDEGASGACDPVTTWRRRSPASSPMVTAPASPWLAMYSFTWARSRSRASRLRLRIMRRSSGRSSVMTASTVWPTVRTSSTFCTLFSAISETGMNPSTSARRTKAPEATSRTTLPDTTWPTR